MDDFSGIAVTGSGRAGDAPDLVRVHLAAEATRPSVQEALDGVVVPTREMRAALVSAGCRESDLATTETSVYSDHDPTPRAQRAQRYVARLGLNVTVRDVATVGQVVERALEVGGNAARLQGMAFSHTDPAALEKRAREAAFADARTRAEHYASLAGRTLGDVVAITEGSSGAMPMAMAAPSFARRADMDITPGDVDVVASVSVRWAWA